MNFRQFINEDTYKKEILTYLKPYLKEECYVCFADKERPAEQELSNLHNFNAVISFPVKHIHSKLKNGKMLNIPHWVTKKFLVIIKPLRGQILNIKEYNKGTNFENDLKILHNFYKKNAHQYSEEKWEAIVFEAAKKRSSSLFLRLLYIMGQIKSETGWEVKNQFQKIKYTAIYSPEGQYSLKTNNPEIYFLNNKNIKYINAIKNR